MSEKLPSSYQRIREVLRIVEFLHHSMEHHCRSAGARARSQRLRLLLRALADRQQEMAALWAEASHLIDHDLTEEWIQYFPGDRLERHLESMERESEDDGYDGGGDISTDVAAAHSDIAEIVRTVANQSGSPKTRELLATLAERESSEARYTSEVIAELGDL